MPHLRRRDSLTVIYEATVSVESLAEWDEEVLVEALIMQAPDRVKDATGWVPDYTDLTWEPTRITFSEGEETYENVNTITFSVTFTLMEKSDN
jgi:hypothetical protein